jgi:hypothetical protein
MACEDSPSISMHLALHRRGMIRPTVDQNSCEMRRGEAFFGRKQWPNNTSCCLVGRRVALCGKRQTSTSCVGNRRHRLRSRTEAQSRRESAGRTARVGGGNGLASRLVTRSSSGCASRLSPNSALRFARSPVRHFRNDCQVVDELWSVRLPCPPSMASASPCEMVPIVAPGHGLTSAGCELCRGMHATVPPCPRGRRVPP